MHSIFKNTFSINALFISAVGIAIGCSKPAVNSEAKGTRDSAQPTVSYDPQYGIEIRSAIYKDKILECALGDEKNTYNTFGDHGDSFEVQHLLGINSSKRFTAEFVNGRAEIQGFEDDKSFEFKVSVQGGNYRARVGQKNQYPAVFEGPIVPHVTDTKVQMVAPLFSLSVPILGENGKYTDYKGNVHYKALRCYLHIKK